MRRLPLVLVAVLAAAAPIACSSSNPTGQTAETPITIGPQTSLAELHGYTCNDPKGDIVSDIKSAGTLTEPGGIDLTVAEAKVDGDALVVTYTVAGDIQALPDPVFILAQGQTNTQFGFELRAAPTTKAGSSGPWGLTMVDWKPKEKRTDLTTAVTVQGHTLSYRVPLASIPKIATLLWDFGASSTDAKNVTLLDDCSSFDAQSPTTTG